MAKGQQRSLGEKPGHLGEPVAPAKHRAQHAHGQRPQQRTGQQHLCQPLPTEACVVGRGRVVVDQRGTIRGFSRTMPTAHLKVRGRYTAAEVADTSRHAHDEREGHIQGKDGHKRSRRNGPQPRVFQRP